MSKKWIMNDYSGTSYWKTKSLLTFFLALEKCTVVLGIGWTMPICVPWFWSHKVKIRDPPPDDLLFIFCLPSGISKNWCWAELGLKIESMKFKILGGIEINGLNFSEGEKIMSLCIIIIIIFDIKLYKWINFFL